MLKKQKNNQVIGPWEFWIDRGGTFTDIIARAPSGELFTHKLLSENPRQYADPILFGIRQLLQLDATTALPTQPIKTIKLGTTIATNALLERNGAPTVLLTTQGFKDSLRIGYQNRPDLFSLAIDLPDMLYRKVIEAPERLQADGQVRLPLDETVTQQRLEDAFAEGYRSLAIVFMHAYRYPEHEIQAEKIAQSIGFQNISVSHQLSPLIKFVCRGDTTVIDAYLSPILDRYIKTLSQQLPTTRISFMQSNGGLADAHVYHGKDSILSGPAGGVVGMIDVGKQAGYQHIIGFDMGGTSTDVSHYHGRLERQFDNQVAGVRIQAPMLNIHTIAAGGGSIIRFAQQRLQVGPESAGANPGPACYRQQGPLTITDCNVLLNRIVADFFPKVFGEQGQHPLDTEIVKQKFATLTQEINAVSDHQRNCYDIASGFLMVAVDSMANAIKRISLQKGFAVSDYVLCCFGGASGQHACMVADKLGITDIIIHPYASLLSAYGIGIAKPRVLLSQTLEETLTSTCLTQLDQCIAQLSQQATDKMQAQDITPEQTETHISLNLHYRGADTEITCQLADLNTLQQNFNQQHQQLFGFCDADKAIMIAAINLEMTTTTQENFTASIAPSKLQKTTTPITHTDIYFDHQFIKTPVFHREQLPEKEVIKGPALIIEPTNTIVVEPQWQATITADNNLLLQRVQQRQQQQTISVQVDPLYLEIFNNQFMSIAEQMGTVLQKTAFSVNIKERLDFSCAIFSSRGELVANAPHIPVHLGSMSESVKAIIQQRQGSMRPGDVFMLNNPYRGGTHLPDITVITPVFVEQQPHPLFFTAARGHHADIGGISPGSMPPNSTTIAEEGIVIDNFQIVADGQFLMQACLALLQSSDYPARNPHQNIADLKAKIAANNKGMQELIALVNHYSLPVVQAYMQHVRDNAEFCVKELLTSLDSGHYSHTMDNGLTIGVDIQINREQQTAVFDFSGSSPQSAHSNFNTPTAVTKAAILYVLRCLIHRNIPLNNGCLTPIDIKLPAHSILNPDYPAAVVAGNVETSQVICDTLFAALNIMASSQGTMNNVTFGNDQYQYYETLCGGSGAGNGFAGCDAIHTHMTNTRLTDPEILELRFPVLLEEFTIRPNSGGHGRFSGGNGVIRKLRFLTAMTTTILANHRTTAPYGLAGGQPGQCGQNYIIRHAGRVEPLAACDQAEMQPGDILVIATPGGGGYGE